MIVPPPAVVTIPPRIFFIYVPALLVDQRTSWFCLVVFAVKEVTVSNIPSLTLSVDELQVG